MILIICRENVKTNRQKEREKNCKNNNFVRNDKLSVSYKGKETQINFLRGKVGI